MTREWLIRRKTKTNKSTKAGCNTISIFKLDKAGLQFSLG